MLYRREWILGSFKEGLMTGKEMQTTLTRKYCIAMNFLLYSTFLEIEECGHFHWIYNRCMWRPSGLRSLHPYGMWHFLVTVFVIRECDQFYTGSGSMISSKRILIACIRWPSESLPCGSEDVDAPIRVLSKLSWLLFFPRWLKDQEDKLPEDSDEDTIASLKDKEGQIAVCFTQ